MPKEDNTNDKPILLTEAVVRRITKDVVKQTLISVGVDYTDPQDMQRDFLFMRDLRLTSEKIKTRGLFVLVGIVVTGIVAVMWLGIRQLLLGN